MAPGDKSSTSNTNPFRIAIIGGGIGGLTTALFLQHFCTGAGKCGSPTSLNPIDIDVNIYEQAPSYRDTVGAGIGIGVNATKLLHRIEGLGDAVNAIAGEKDGIWFTLRRFDNSEEITTVYSNDDGKIKQAAVARPELLAVLRSFVEKNGAARVTLGKKCRAVEDLGKAVRMRFEDGTSAEADLVIACDGIHSAVRQQFIQDKAVYSGKFIYRGTVPITELPSPWPFPSYSTMWIGSGKHVVVYAISANQRLNFVGCVSKSEDKIRDFRESWSLTCDRKELEQEFSDCDELVQKIIKLLPERPSKWLINDRDPLAKWTFMGGKVALLGDAAHAMVPHQSAGGGQAIEDAYIISKALAEYLDEKRTNRARAPGLEKWMNLYQTIRLPRSQRVQETSREAGLLFQLQVPEMQGKSYDESLPILVEGVNGRFKWIWSEDIDVAYDRARTELLENEAVRRSKRGWCFCM